MTENNLKIFIENNHLKYFIETNIGREFVKEEKCINVHKNEKPDYIFETLTGNIGFELTVLAENTPYANLFHSLTSIVNKVFKKIDKELEYKYFLNLICMENNIEKIAIKEKELVEQIFSTIADYEKKGIVSKKSKYSIGLISIEGKHHIEEIVMKNNLKFKLVFSKHDKYNFGGTPVFSPVYTDPIDLIQSIINKKEVKKSKYNNCKKYCLLIISDPFIARGNSYNFSNEVFKHTFNSSFDNIFLLELGGENNLRASKLKCKQDILGNKNAK